MIYGHVALAETVLVDHGQDRAEAVSPTQPETQLWQAVVLQAWQDATKVTGCNVEDRRTAHLFLSGATEEWRRARAWVCEHAEIDECMLVREYSSRIKTMRNVDKLIGGKAKRSDGAFNTDAG